MPPSTKLSLLVNGLTALLNAGVSLVLLLIAPLGLATVITLTLAIAACTFVAGLAGDALLLWALPASRSAGTAGTRPQWRLPRPGLPPRR